MNKHRMIASDLRLGVALSLVMAGVASAQAPTPAPGDPAAPGPEPAPAAIGEPSLPTPDQPPAVVPPTVVTGSTEHTAAPPRVHLGLQAGVIFPQLQSELGSTAALELEGGYRVAANLSLQLAVGYARPTAETSQEDPRLPAGEYMTTTNQSELTISLGGFWRFLPVGSSVNGYAGLAARVWLLESKTIGEAGGQTFLENRETSTRFGGAIFGGGEYRLGPGAAVLEIDLGGSDLPHLITGDVATTALNLTVGYRLFL